MSTAKPGDTHAATCRVCGSPVAGTTFARAEFGEAYDRYAEAIPAFFPRQFF